MKQFLLLGGFLAGSLGLTLAQKVPTAQGPQNILTADTTIVSVAKDSTLLLAQNTSTAQIAGLFEAESNKAMLAPRLNPRAVSFVEDYMDKYSKDLQDMKSWALPYFNMMDGIMVQHGLPRELKYLAVIESKMKAGATSWAGAVGPWQLMPGTAVELGLKVNRKVDERRNYVKSTHAAARYLKDLYAQYGDWLLVIAAYNGGPGAVQKAIAKSGSRNFWDLQYYLPAETRTHVKKFIGTHYIFEGQGGLTTLTKAETTEHYGQHLYAFTRNLTADELSNVKEQKVSGKYQSVIIAKHISMSLEDFKRYNPDFDKLMSKPDNKGYKLNLPKEKMDLFNANKYSILQESVDLMLNGNSVSTL
ncbi:MAG TPA: transglycosylase SLT domain-containing protein [Flavihumibacter sp.]|nr:transglycosylase SLT domain-containing protein [Bacteroidota bacterium]HOA37456.1 transglycosylase SLT domain-containing protein [Flavihumibacter sp.]HPZ88959.1 transglycosylase SLT domain-containing protein [Flavihumibacter sp.]HQD08460.1 transglycosylase SLT domain-containing protein [Flavihumibacter sp.]